MMLKNKSILVTGVGKGLGHDILLKIIDQGGFVYGITRSKSDLKKFKKIKNCKIFIGDIANPKCFLKVINQSKKDKRIISGLVNNAGVRQRLKFDKITENKLLNLFKINFFSAFKNMQFFAKYLKEKKKSGSIVNIGSIVGVNGFKELVGYASSKTALIGLTKSFAVEMARFNIRANMISPGFIKTSYFSKFKKKKNLYKWTVSRIPLGKWGEVNDISFMVCFLLSDKSSYITGTNINIDGGWTGA